MRPLFACFLLLGLFAGCLEPLPGPTAEDGPEPVAPGSYEVLRVCIPVADPVPFVVGTLTVPSSAPQRLLVFLPGTQGMRLMFDENLHPDVQANVTFQRYLATRGVASLAIDRPGIGESRYDGPGQSLDEWEQTLTEILRIAREGTWHVDDSGCAAAKAFPQLVLAGHSLGAVLAIHYMTTHQNIQGLLAIGAPVQSANAKTLSLLVMCDVMHFDLKDGRGPGVCEDSREPLGDCHYLVAYAPTSDEAATEAFCQRLYEERDGLRSEDRYRAAFENVARIRVAPGIPVHLLFFEFDWAVSNPGQEEQNRQDAINAFSSCCPTTHYTVPGTGHVWNLHPNQEGGYQSVVDWLETIPE